MISINHQRKPLTLPPPAPAPVVETPPIWDRLLAAFSNGITSIIRSNEKDSSETVKALGMIANSLTTAAPEKPLAEWEFTIERDYQGKLSKLTAKQKA